MKVRSLNKYQTFVYGLIDGIIYDLSRPNNRQNIDGMIAEADVLRQLCNKLERFKPNPSDEVEADSFLNYICYDIQEMVPGLASSNLHHQIKSLISAYSRIFLSDVFKEDCNASAMITNLILCKNRTLQSKWLTTDSKKEQSIKVFISEIEKIIHKLEPLVV